MGQPGIVDRGRIRLQAGALIGGGGEMKQKVIELFLLLAVILGGFMAWTSGRERTRLKSRYEHLARITGDLPIEDASRVHILALETEEPLHFAWRIYFPPNYPVILSSRNGGHSNSPQSDSQETIVRVRLRENAHGRLQVFTKFSGGSSLFSLGDQAFAEWLRGHWAEIQIQQLGVDTLAVLKADQQAALLRLSLPEGLQQEARRTLPARAQNEYVPTLFELRLGPTAPKP